MSEDDPNRSLILAQVEEKENTKQLFVGGDDDGEDEEQNVEDGGRIQDDSD